MKRRMKDEVVRFRVNKDVKEWVRKKAEARRTTESEIVRQILLDQFFKDREGDAAEDHKEAVA